MSSDAIIAGLKQGNAMEMATIEEVKAGMNSVLDGMLRECFNRSDGLSELTEKLQLEYSSATATNFTAPQILQLMIVIKDAISSCEQAMIINDRKQEREIEQAKSAFEVEKKTRKVICDHLNDHIDVFNESQNTMSAMSEDFSIPASLIKLRGEENKLLHKLSDIYTELNRDAKARRAIRFKEIKDTYEKEQNEFKKQIASLERIAIIARIDLKATSRDEASDHMSLQEPQFAHLSLISSPVGRGGRGGFSFVGGVRGLGGVGRGRGIVHGQAKSYSIKESTS